MRAPPRNLEYMKATVIVFSVPVRLLRMKAQRAGIYQLGLPGTSRARRRVTSSWQARGRQLRAPCEWCRIAYFDMMCPSARPGQVDRQAGGVSLIPSLFQPALSDVDKPAIAAAVAVSHVSKRERPAVVHISTGAVSAPLPKKLRS